MKTNAAVLFEPGRDWEIREVELDPRALELMRSYAA